MKRTQLNFDEKTYYQLVSYARERKTSISSAARELISKQVEKEKFSTKSINPFHFNYLSWGESAQGLH